MTPRPGRARLIPRGGALLPLAALLPLTGLLVGACTTSRNAGSAGPRLKVTPAVTPAATPAPTTPAPAPTPTPTPTRTRSVTPSPTRRTPRPTTPPPTTARPLTLAEYIALIPAFPPAPKPRPVALTRVAGQAAWQYQIPTTQPVAFLTIDDGIVRKPEAIALLRAAKVPVTLFLTIDFIEADPGYYRQLQELGAVIESHTVTHPHLPELSYDGQKQELCDSTDQLAELYGRRPLYFRPPFGERNDDTLRAAWDCGLLAGFHWRETVNEGIVRYQRTDQHIHAGDIILMHFRPAFEADFIAALQAIHAAGLTPALLEDYVQVAT